MRTILIIGASNSGKKTILNKLTNHDVEFQCYDYEKIVLKDQVDYLLRLSGENQLNLMNEKLDEDVDGIIFVINNRAGFTEDDQGMINLIREKLIPHVIFANKQDLKSGNIINNTESLVIPTIATKGIGVNDGLSLLLEMIGPEETEQSKYVSEPEHRQEPEPKPILNYRPSKVDEKSEIRNVRFFLSPVEFENVKKKLEAEGFGNITIKNIKHIDKALEKRETYRTYTHTLEYPEKVEVMMVTMKDNITYICKALAGIKSDDIEDNIIVSPVENVIRIRTREKGENAIE